MSSSAHPVLLEIAKFYFSEKNARDYVIRLLKATGVQRSKSDWDQSFELRTGKTTRRVEFKDLVQEARETGRVEMIQQVIDNSHPVFGGTFGMAVSSPNMTLGVDFAGYKKQLKGPARNYPVEGELGADILECRRLACKSSSPPDFAESTRYYRLYLFCCVALVDAFINRCILLAQHRGVSGEVFRRLSESRTANERLELWVAVFGTRTDIDLKAGKAWDHYQKLRRERNHQIHAIEPFLGYRMAKLPQGLNYCREGVGGLLAKLLRIGDYPEYSLFERLRRAPIVRYVGK